ncbi:hypothetical protein GOARA_056_00320 [Gordonia araii NBRC 100433]|uniref:Uncharacterized protein n=1 Tax=Gordonia araii NBRC 100433 TaxID=1073574 RepID=G7H360_9ACTN|nr:hypothetical protein GOARA_056_00320 [Gordonia araii NBRC 100433]
MSKLAPHPAAINQRPTGRRRRVWIPPAASSAHAPIAVNVAIKDTATCEMCAETPLLPHCTVSVAPNAAINAM